VNILYWKWDKAISKETCEFILSSLEWKNKSIATISPKNEPVINEKVRKTELIWQNNLSIVGCIADSYIRAANLVAKWNYDITTTENVQIAKYKIDGFYNWHADEHFGPENNEPRKLSLSLQLSDNSNFVGGQLELKDADEQPTMEQGSIIVFPSLLEHRVTPVTKGERISVVSWMHGPKFK
jgi:PKHD-type hydroxylase